MSTPVNKADAPEPTQQSIVWWFARLTPIAFFFAAGIILIVLLGLAQRVGWIGVEGSSAATSGGSAQQIYTCPMHPQIRQPGPGRCPICGMPLVPASSGAADLDEFAVTIQPAQRRLAQIQTAPATSEPVSTTIETIGAIEIDESREATIAAYINGRVERLFADYTGVLVAKGDHLAIVYSPQLYAAQAEYLESRNTVGRMNANSLPAIREAQTKLMENSRQKLVELGMTPEQLAELEKSGKPESRLTIYAPFGGTVIEKLTEEGEYISAGEPIYRIANLSTVWLMLELYPENASQIRFGQVVTAELPSLPGETLIGRVAFIDPKVNDKNRTVGVRVEFKNDSGRLRPGDYAEATIEIPIGPQGAVYDEQLAGKWISPMHPQIIRDEPGACPICGMELVPTSRYGYSDQPLGRVPSTVIPRSALLTAGKNSVVYVETEPGRFEIRSVKLGPILKDKVVILDGIKPGELVATSGNFLIDSQMQLAGKPSLIDPSRLVHKKTRNSPLQVDSTNLAKVGGETGQNLEAFYQTYFAIQSQLAADKQPAPDAAKRLFELAGQLSKSPELSEPERKQFADVAKNAEHLHHLSLAEARKNFKPISHATLLLATEVRGDGSTQAFHQFFCPMVKGGEGDWLQADDKLLNPYYGSEMLRCGEHVRTLSPDAPPMTPMAPPAQQPTAAEGVR
ncbi:efflux RND transporter periplasmic adaptor subunit [Blastopirellula sp. JC732]|uniref:Efflux RND transporter periplasmic adaptor subunit n=1 Tax=Blastopirellula sediminis TaxID=2894196 RepID=A0A9X1MKU8_9BACT|nr:efflux RND transporter periplasmic adaptor subunit [Blastopirellula sediminis]MCC9608782.1 efflux RND transporter periplasmic adaptor subunit [Blastopirellula sediminis]MCC9628441.1 efflux RND transporter periplasmic adaptor subunit [Blastopirellula sediminis]